MQPYRSTKSGRLCDPGYTTRAPQDVSEGFPRCAAQGEVAERTPGSTLANFQTEFVPPEETKCKIIDGLVYPSSRHLELQPGEATNEAGTVSHDIDRAGGCFSHLQRGRRDVGCRWRTGEWHVDVVRRRHGEYRAGMDRPARGQVDIKGNTLTFKSTSAIPNHSFTVDLKALQPDGSGKVVGTDNNNREFYLTFEPGSGARPFHMTYRLKACGVSIRPRHSDVSAIVGTSGPSTSGALSTSSPCCSGGWRAARCRRRGRSRTAPSEFQL